MIKSNFILAQQSKEEKKLKKQANEMQLNHGII
jgi:hypothetical protein